MSETRQLATTQAYVDAFQAERSADWSGKRRREFDAHVQEVVDQADPATYVRVGERIDPFVLDEVDGGKVVLDDLLEHGPVVVLFFRYATCGPCIAALRGYQATLAGPLRQRGVPLVAVSPQVRDLLREIKDDNGLEFLVASDPGAELVGVLGIGYGHDEQAREAIRAQGADVGELLGTGDWTFPHPTAIVVARDRVVRFVDVHPNWMERTPEVTILEEVDKLV
jgi:peroxiredoxin